MFNKKEHNKQKYIYFLSIGKCPRHCDMNVLSGKTVCQKCVDNWKKHYNNTKKEKHCVIHPNRPAVEGKISCQECINNKKINRLKNIKISKCPTHPNESTVGGCKKCLNNRRLLRKKYCYEWNTILHERGQDKCSKCGYDNLDVIDFHHKDKDKKICNIRDLKRKKFKPEYLKELDKCIPLCSNCHRKTHYGNITNTQYKIRKDEWHNIFKFRGQDKCSKCGYDKGLNVIDFHHKDKDKKIMNISRLIRLKFKPEYLIELDKCISLCSNCHKELHVKGR